MGRSKKKSQTPRRTSTRKRERTAKGKYYDEHFGDFTSETHVTGLHDITPPIAPELDSTRIIEELVAANEEGGLGGSSGLNILECPTDGGTTNIVENSLQYLSHIYDLHHLFLDKYGEFETDMITHHEFDQAKIAEDDLEINVDEADNHVVVIVEQEEVEEAEQERGARVKAEGREVGSPGVLSLKLKQKNTECDELRQRVFELTQKMKVGADRIRYLENNDY